MTLIQQKVIAVLHERPLLHSEMDSNIEGNWQDAIHSLYDNGYVSVWFREDSTKTKYALTSKGEKAFIAYAERELPFTDWNFLPLTTTNTRLIITKRHNEKDIHDNLSRSR